MKSWSDAARDGLLSGGLAAAATIAVLAARGWRDNASVTAPINAVSHVFWGDEALRETGTTLRHTLPGLLVHGASALMWAVLYERWAGDPGGRSLLRLTRDTAAATAAIAAVDLKLVPKRLTPGFERRLSPTSLSLVYVALGAGLMAGTSWAARQRLASRASSASNPK